VSPKEAKLDGKIVPVVVCREMPTMAEIARVMSEVIGREVRTEYVGEAEFQEQRGKIPPVASQGWARDGWLDVDVEEVRRVLAECGVETGTLRGFLEREKEALGRGFD
jgi:hypothetical protein